MATDAEYADVDAGLTHRQIMTVISGLMLGMFLASLDQTIVVTATRTIGDDLHSLSNQAWITTAFLITSTITIPLFGKLSDIYGRKPFFMLAIAIFIVGSVLCGTAQSMYELAAFRAVQGVGAGGLVPLALAILGDILAPRQRGRYQAYFTGLFAIASVFGPVVGGFFAGTDTILGISGWRWIFYMNIPIGIAALVVVQSVLTLEHTRRDHRIDWAGAATLVLALVPLLVITEQGRTWGWGSRVAWLCYLVAGAGMAAFITVERRLGVEALLPLNLFRDRVFAVGAMHSFIVGIAMFGGVVSIPLYLQLVKGASPTESGLLILPLAAGIMFSSLAAAQVIAHIGRYRMLPILGSSLLVSGFLLFTTVGADTPLWRVDICMVAIGIGLGTSLQPVILAMQNAVDPRDMGVATSASTSFRQVGGTLGTALFLSILFSTAANRIPKEYAGATDDPSYAAAAAVHPDQVRLLGGRINLDDTSFIRSLDSALAHPFRVAFSSAMDLTYLIGSAIMIAAVVLALLLKERPLRTADELTRLRAEISRGAGAPPG